MSRFSSAPSVSSIRGWDTIDRTAARRPAAVAFIFVTVVLDVLALGIIIPVLPKRVDNFLSGNTGRAAEIYGLFGSVWALMQFVCSPLLGALSDRYGRRPVILLSNFGLGLDYIFMALAPSLSWLFVGRIISGITGASFTTAGAYIADVTPPEKRAGSYGLIGAAWGLGVVLGPALGGVLGDLDPRMPFWVAAGMTLLICAGSSNGGGPILSGRSNCFGPIRSYSAWPQSIFFVSWRPRCCPAFLSSTPVIATAGMPRR